MILGTPAQKEPTDHMSLAIPADQSADLTPTKPSEQTIQPTRIDQMDINSLPITLGGGNVKWVNLHYSFARDGHLLTGDIIGFWEGSINNKDRFEQLLDMVEQGIAHIRLRKHMRLLNLVWILQTA